MSQPPVDAAQTAAQSPPPPGSGAPSPSGGFKIDNAIMLAALSIVAYAIVLLYDTGYSHFYGLNSEFIKPDPFSFFYVVREVLRTTFVPSSASPAIQALDQYALLMTVIAAAALGFGQFRAFREQTDPRTRYNTLTVIITTSLMFLTSSFFLIPAVALPANALLFWLYLLALRVLSNWMFSRMSPEKRAESEERIARVASPAYSRRARIACAVVILISPVYFLGYQAAKSQHRIFVSADKPTYALLKLSGDFVITSPAVESGSSWERKLKITGAFRIFKLGDKETPTFEPREYEIVDVDRALVFSKDDWLEPYVIQ